MIRVIETLQRSSVTAIFDSLAALVASGGETNKKANSHDQE
jgi:hypothetical protein